MMLFNDYLKKAEAYNAFISQVAMYVFESHGHAQIIKEKFILSEKRYIKSNTGLFYRLDSEYSPGEHSYENSKKICRKLPKGIEFEYSYFHNCNSNNPAETYCGYEYTDEIGYDLSIKISEEYAKALYHEKFSEAEDFKVYLLEQRNSLMQAMTSVWCKSHSTLHRIIDFDTYISTGALFFGKSGFGVYYNEGINYDVSFYQYGMKDFASFNEIYGFAMAFAETAAQTVKMNELKFEVLYVGYSSTGCSSESVIKLSLNKQDNAPNTLNEW